MKGQRRSILVREEADNSNGFPLSLLPLFSLVLPTCWKPGTPRGTDTGLLQDRAIEPFAVPCCMPSPGDALQSTKPTPTKGPRLNVVGTAPTERKQHVTRPRALPEPARIPLPIHAPRPMPPLSPASSETVTKRAEAVTDTAGGTTTGQLGQARDDFFFLPLANKQPSSLLPLLLFAPSPFPYPSLLLGPL